MKVKVSNLGSVKNVTTGRILKPILTGIRVKYLAVVLNGQNHRVHRLVGIHFKKNPKNLPQINHKDKNTFNNKSNNLEWVSNRENRSHGSKNKTSKFVGVSFDSSKEKWTSWITIKGESLYLGRFDNELHASKAYKKALRENGLTNKYA